MYQIVMTNQYDRLNKKKASVSTNLAVSIGGIMGGLFLMLIGLILSAVSYTMQVNFHGREVILLVTAFVLLAIGAHFLDKLDAAEKAAKIESYNNHRFTIKQSKEYKSADKHSFTN